jgi:OmpA-OmpF porin, OOP family
MINRTDARGDASATVAGHALEGRDQRDIPGAPAGIHPPTHGVTMSHIRWRSVVAILAVIAFASAALPPSSNAQGIFKRIKQAAKEQAKDKVVQRGTESAGKATDKVLDKTENAVVCLASDAACIRNAKDQGKQVSVTDESGGVVSGADSAAAIAAAQAAPSRPGEGAWANYDFVPGERPIFVDDFSKDKVGNFPRRLEFRSGNMEIVEWQGQRWLRSGGHDVLGITLPETLPERFTMEFDLAGSGNSMEINFLSEQPNESPRLEIDTHNAYLRADPIRGEGALGVETSKTPVKIRIAVDGTYLKLYANEHRALNVPNAKLGRSKHIYINMNGWSADDPRMIANIRIAAGGKELYDALAEKGRVATQGILFATGSAEIAGESTPTLEEIGQMLKDHADLSLTIEGHTDNTGNAAANQALSEKRAAAVKQYLITTYKIAESRLHSKGFGASKPAGSNDTPEGRQQNRRVELVKM